jgi:pimeloyl-ACP methyl ester carboxylesterase
MPRTLLSLLALTVVALLAGCGGGSTASKPSVEGPIVQGPNGVYLFRPAGTPKALVIFLHGQGGPTETTPHNHRPWFDHLTAGGAAVVYPRFELDYSRGVLDHAVAGIRTAVNHLGAGDLPVLVIGHSRGAALAVEYAAVAKSDHAPVPKAIYSVEPVAYGEQTHIVDFQPIDHATRVVLVVGDRDPNAAGGAHVLLERLQKGQFPGTEIKIQLVRSHGAFVADHLAVLRDSPGAQQAFWHPVDRLLEQIER